MPNQIPVLDGPRRVFVDGSREHGAAELGAVLLEAAPPAHRALLRLPDPRSPGSVDGPERTVIREPSVSALYAAIPFYQDASVLIIGERTNANGSKAFREAMLREDWQKCLDIARADPRRSSPARTLHRPSAVMVSPT